LEGVNGADLGLSISEMSLKILLEDVEILHAGDHVKFQAVI
jgi:hypothetical protein